MRRSWCARATAAVFLLTLASPPGPRAAGGATKPAEPPRTIELHIGVPGLVYVGQPLQEFLKKFPKAQSVPFSGQQDATSVSVEGAGLSCIAVGNPGDLKLASVGFNLDGTYPGMAEGTYRTSKGIGKGSTVNDLLEAYGRPAEISGERPRGTTRPPQRGSDPPKRQRYQYANADNTVRTYFLVDENRVTQIVVNDLGPLDQHIVKAPPKKK